MVHVRDIEPNDSGEVALVAERMRETLIEVLGEAAGTQLYSLEWLRERVRFHIAPARDARGVVAIDHSGAIVGHALMRVEGQGSQQFALFSTVYVVPSARHRGIARALLREVERWAWDGGLTVVRYATAETNLPLQTLFSSEGYRIAERAPERSMIVLEKKLIGPASS